MTDVSNITSFSNAFNSRAKLILTDRPNAEFWLKNVQLPDITLSTESTKHQPYDIKHPGNNITYGDLSLTVFLDENFQVYKELYNWLYLGLPGEDHVDPKSNGMVLIFNNSLKSVIAKFNFAGLFLPSIPSLSYDNYGADPLELSLTLQYDSMTPEFEI